MSAGNPGVDGPNRVSMRQEFPDYMKNWFTRGPYRIDSRTDLGDGFYRQTNQRGQFAGINEILQFYRQGGRKYGIPTGRRYRDFSLSRSMDYYGPGDEYIDSSSNYFSRKKDDKEKTFEKKKGKYDFTRRGAKRKTVEIGGEDLNWLQRNLPSLFLERYKVKSKYDDEGQLRKRVTTSREGGRQVERFPAQSELEAMIAADILKLQNQ